jgi:RNA polymerase sigma-70 factor, ECF subfamily
MPARQTDQQVLSEERELVKALMAGDPAAFEVFETEYIPGVYRFAAAHLRDQRELVREVVQGALCKAIENLSTFRGESSLFTWLCAICRTTIAGHFRREQSRPRLVAIEESVPATTRDPEQAAAGSEQAMLVHRALDGLPPRHAQALEWKYIDGVSVRDIAARLQMSEKAAESLLTRAREAFREAYGERS